MWGVFVAWAVNDTSLSSPLSLPTGFRVTERFLARRISNTIAILSCLNLTQAQREDLRHCSIYGVSQVPSAASFRPDSVTEHSHLPK